MKRINPDTGKPFKKGDSRPDTDVQDGKVFNLYTPKVAKHNGYRIEHWVTPRKLEDMKLRAKEASRKRAEESKASGKKRLNPDTGVFFSRGDVRPTGDNQDGKVFESYRSSRVILKGKNKGFFEEVWSVRDGKKRINPETNQPFKKGEILDGKRFVYYKRRVDDDGFYMEQWSSILDLSNGKKRLNPKTNKEFVRGDTREDGSVFIAYRYGDVKKNGYFQEQWSSPESLKAQELSVREGVKRINPETGTIFKKGDKREDGYRFSSYQTKRVDKEGFFYESWLQEDIFLQRQNKFNRSPHMTLRNIQRRAKEGNIPFDLDEEYLIQIFPEDNKCPVLGIEFEWGIHNSQASPSVDRIIPEKGYTKGNVIWISRRANAIKNDATVEEIYIVADFYKELLSKSKD